MNDDDWVCEECGDWDYELVGVGREAIKRCKGCGLFDDGEDLAPPERQFRTKMRPKDDVGSR